jgi:hypothetical protein
MRKKTLSLVVVLAALGAVAASASSRGPAVAVPGAVKAPAKGVPLLAVVPGQRGPVLGRADRRAVWIARRSPRLRIFNQLGSWAYAPDGSRLAIATESLAGGDDPIPTIQFIQPMLVQRLGSVKLSDGHVAAIAWGSGDRVNLVLRRWCCPASFDVVGIDAGLRKVVQRQRISRAIVQVQQLGDTIVALTAPETGIGTAILIAIDGSGSVRSATLDKIRAGSDMPSEGESPDPAKMRQNIPALALDPDGAAAFVVPAAGQVARISLSTLAVSYHSVAEPVSLLGRLHDLVEPKAVAKGLTGPIRNARWLGEGVLAVSGGDEAVSVDAAAQMHISWTPAGLRLIDTSTWGSKLIDRGADSFTVERDSLLATGSTWTTDGGQRGMGFAAYGFDGARRLAVLRGSSVALALVFRGRAYLGYDLRKRTKVVDLGTGRLLKDRRAPLAQLLIGEGAAN